jgi:1,4-alpha-glucan branching enzyme
MGAIPHKNGTAFRVWVPHATAVSVIGTFNDWEEGAAPMVMEGNGYWYADVAGACPGDEYKFLIQAGGKSMARIDPYAREVTNSVGNGIIHDPDFDWGDDDFSMPPWNDLIIYEMHIGTFNDQPGGPPGNLDQAIEKLAYLKDLGINAVQIMPPMEFAGGFSWGYNPVNIFSVERDYGGAPAMKTFIKAAHALGIAVIFDVVYNHLGPSDLDLWQFDGWSENNKGGIYFYNDHRSKTPWGDTRPDYGRPEVRQFIRDNVLMWLEEYHVDGLRWDATAYIRNTFGNNNNPSNDIPDGWGLMQWINDEIAQRQPWKIQIAEDLRGNRWLTTPTRDGGAGFGAQWAGGFVHPVREAVITGFDHAREMGAVSGAIYQRFSTDAFQRVIYTESHDEVANGRARVPEEIWPDQPDHYFAKKRSTLGTGLVFTAPGIPMLFQGQEFLEDEWFHDQDPLDWAKRERFGGLVQMYRDMIRLRRNWYNNTRGLRGQHVHVYHINDFDKVIAFHRWDQGGPGDSVVAVLNMANRSFDHYEIGFPNAGLWRVRFNGDWKGYDSSFGDHFSYDTEAHHSSKDGLPAAGSVGIGPYTMIILSQ